ncbi:MAG TPA: hypothetical protein VLA43_19620 [Longimicrobiales bacterium]|nr:hypothetical protein [Longimicrobiales bacterium]
MSEAPVPNRVPSLVYVAPLVPTFLVMLLFVLGELGAGVPRVSTGVLLYAWLFSTVPLALLAVGVRSLSVRLRGEGLEMDMARTSHAITWAEGTVERARLLLEEADALLEQRIRAREALDAAPGADAKEEKGRRRGSRTGVGRGVAVAAVVVLVALAGAAGWALNGLPEAPEQVHLHAAFAVYVDGERVEFTDPYFDLGRSGFLRAHLHAPDQDIMHVEGEPGLTLEEFFRLSLRAELDQGALRLDEEVHGGLTVVDNATHPLRLFVAPDGGGAWSQVLHVPGYVMHDRDRILLTYGNATGAELEAQFASVSRSFPTA